MFSGRHCIDKTTFLRIFALQRLFFGLLVIVFFISNRASATLDQNSAVKFQTAITLFNEKRFAEAEQSLLQLNEISPEQPLILFNLGHSQYAQEKYREAFRSYRAVARLQTPLKPAARYYQARCLRWLNRPNRALRILRILLKQRLPENLTQLIRSEIQQIQESKISEDNAQLALELYNAGRFREALTSLNQQKLTAPEQESDSVTADRELLRALILIRLNEIAQARQTLRRIRQNSTDSAVRSAATNLLLTIQPGRDDQIRDWWFLESGLGYRKNPYFSAQSEPRVDRGFYRLSGGAGYTHRLTTTQSLRPRVTFFFEDVFDEPNLRTLDTSAAVAWERARDGILLRVSPYFSLSTWNDRASLHSHGMRLGALRTAGQLELGGDFVFAWQRAIDTSLASLSGRTPRLRLFSGISIFPVYLFFEWSLNEDAIGDLVYNNGDTLPLAYWSHGPSVLINWRINPNWSSQSSVSLQLKSYKTPTQPGLEVRKDQTSALRTRLSRHIERLSLFLELGAIENSSTLGAEDPFDKNFRSQVVLFGVSYE